MLRKTMIVLATAATFTGVLTADAFARRFSGAAHMGGGFAGGGFRAPIIRSAFPRIHGGAFAHFPRRRSRYDAPSYSGYDYDFGEKVCDRKPILRRHLIAFLLDLYLVHRRLL